ncbi:hypothetical protein [Anaeromyxobacter oryzae]|nr:hypothetical protein [Anaeromyxobacter oryzae]
MARQAKGPLPDLRDTGRRYLDGTRGARLASPGVERFVRPRRRGPALAAAGVALVAALVAAMLLLR